MGGYHTHMNHLSPTPRANTNSRIKIADAGRAKMLYPFARSQLERFPHTLVGLFGWVMLSLCTSAKDKMLRATIGYTALSRLIKHFNFPERNFLALFFFFFGCIIFVFVVWFNKFVNFFGYRMTDTVSRARAQQDLRYFSRLNESITSHSHTRLGRRVSSGIVDSAVFCIWKNSTPEGWRTERDSHRMLGYFALRHSIHTICSF